MSTEGAIAGVTAVLQQVLNDRIGAAVNGAIVTARPLDKAQPTEGKSVLNLFLYQAVTNGAFSNLPMPGTHPGIDDRPPVALNLEYLLTVFGRDDADEAPVEGHLLMGAALRALLDQPALRRTDIRKFAPGTGLDRQVDQIRLTPRPMSLDDVSKLWTAFQAPYRLSTAIEASCVLIETRPPKPTPVPVIKRGSDDRGPTATARSFPVIERLTFGALERPLPAAVVGETVQVDGQSLTPAPGHDAVLRVQPADGTTAFDLPLAPTPGGSLGTTLDPAHDWKAGAHRASVVHVAGGKSAADSQDVMFALAPRIEAVGVRVPGSRAATPGVVKVRAGSPDSVVIELRVVPGIGAGQAAECQWQGQHLVRVDPPGAVPDSYVAFRIGRPAGTAPGATTPASPLRLRVGLADSLPFRYVDRDHPDSGFEMDDTQQVEVRWA